ncbi:MAB_1171c family putative transporter [Streptomyces sp. 7N604]|uniref:MAB_1171c family putative transporter n=1 Tax=Streptomyces sp. 7N604 TaxID=3457415 RepID=UPI003FD467AC
MTELLLLGIAAAVAWKLYQLARDPHDAPLRSVTLCLLTAALSYPLAMPGGASGVDTVAGHGTAKLVQNVLLLLTVYFLMCFYLYSADEQAGRRRARREAVVVALVALSITVAAVSVPHQVFAGSFSTADMTISQIAFFYAGAGVYLMYALSVAGQWTRRYARMSSRPHSTGLWMAAIGLGAMAVACAVRAVIVAIRWGGGTVPRPLMAGVAFLLVVSILLFVAGVTYPGASARIASVRLWLRHRRDYRRLTPLWQLLSEAYPENVLRPASPALRDQWRARGVHRRYHRRIVECRDGLVDISPYLVDEEDDSSVLDLDAAELADRLRQAVTRIGQGDPAPRQAVPLAMSLGDDRESDVRQLIAVSDALHPSGNHR